MGKEEYQNLIEQSIIEFAQGESQSDPIHTVMIDYEHCHFCKCYCDLIGCDTAKIIEGQYMWCGQCNEGQIFKFRDCSNERLEELKQIAQKWLDNSGLDWENRGNDFLTWAKYLDNYDLIDHIDQELERRNNG